MGLMQIMPETYAELRFRYHLGADPYAPRSNILAGAAYLHELHDRYGAAGFLAAYNAGPGRYEDYLMRGRPLPEETRNYVAALAPKIGVPTLPRQPESTSFPRHRRNLSQTYDKKSQSTTVSENGFLPRKSPFENQRNTRTGTLFAALHDAFERTSSSMDTVDKTALEPSPNRTLSAISVSRRTSAESQFQKSHNHRSNQMATRYSPCGQGTLASEAHDERPGELYRIIECAFRWGI